MAQLKELVVTGPSSFIGNVHALGNNKAIKIGNASYSAGLHMGSGGVNRGLYDFTLNKWMVYADSNKIYLNGNAETATTLSSTLTADKGGTGHTSLINAANALMNALETSTSTPSDADYFISQYANGGTSYTTYHRRPVSALWSYMNGKAATVYAKLQSPNNMIHNSNEICWVPDSYNNYIWINYRSVGGTGKSTVTGYKFGNANGKTENVFVEANTFSLLQSANMTYNSTDKCIEFTFA